MGNRPLRSASVAYESCPSEHLEAQTRRPLVRVDTFDAAEGRKGLDGAVLGGVQVVYQSVARDGVVGLLREHLRANLLKLGRYWHYQRKGIPQVRVSPRVRLS